MVHSSHQQNLEHLLQYINLSTSHCHFIISSRMAKQKMQWRQWRARLFTKCQDSGQSEYLALLDWCNTSTEGTGTSPAQRFLGRTLLTVTAALLTPDYPMQKDSTKLWESKQRQQHYCNRQTKLLQLLAPGDTTIRSINVECWRVQWISGPKKL